MKLLAFTMSAFLVGCGVEIDAPQEQQAVESTEEQDTSPEVEVVVAEDKPAVEAEPAPEKPKKKKKKKVKKAEVVVEDELHDVDAYVGLQVAEHLLSWEAGPSGKDLSSSAEYLADTLRVERESYEDGSSRFVISLMKGELKYGTSAVQVFDNLADRHDAMTQDEDLLIISMDSYADGRIGHIYFTIAIKASELYDFAANDIMTVIYMSGEYKYPYDLNNGSAVAEDYLDF